MLLGDLVRKWRQHCLAKYTCKPDEDIYVFLLKKDWLSSWIEEALNVGILLE